ncbi:hypothetical protein [Oceanobacillus indicireducens]|uniref:Uncharacterized protein n=1 Tax=Oceanobacillus indicireducens TaxID=1004261 RepID=A0A917Y5M3_9BACI|nr:hypothetical protein [Oceanobacillus indicireducens]GGN66318.1 hypothetical protein GCM10007971_36150 [Oceanobacillus indicireducens]
MTHKELQSYRNRFEEIKKSDEPIRTRKLASLMSDLELSYNIPVFAMAVYEKNNPEVMALYREVSNARTF